MMEAYNVKYGTKVIVTDENVKTPPDSMPVNKGDEITIHKVDGMYVNATDQNGNRIYIAAWTEVKVRYLVYKITNRKNGKSYIGQTSVGLEKRWKQHVYNAVNHVHDNHFKRAIRKWGEGAFTTEVLIDNLSLEEANHYEELYVEIYGTFDFGYNSTRGGDNHEKAEEVKKKLSEAAKGRTHSDETKSKLSEARKSEKNPFYGRTHSDETKKKMSRATKGKNNPLYGKPHSDETKKKISDAKIKTPVIAVDKNTGEVRSLASTQEAGRVLGVHPPHVSRAARKNRDLRPATGTNYSAGDYHCFYPDDYEKYKKQKKCE